MPRIDDCYICRYYAWDFHLVCAVHPSGPDDETCEDFERDPETEAILYRDFLGLGEPVEQNGAINNPWHCDPEENWRRQGRSMLMGSWCLRRNGCHTNK